MLVVVAGVIYKDDKFLIAKRSFEKDQGGLWEFPGGKVESGESYEMALVREIREEFNADIVVENYIGEVVHSYPEKVVKLAFYRAKLLSDGIELLEHEDFKWITKEEKDDYQFAGADMLLFDFI